MFWYGEGRAYHQGLQSTWCHGHAHHTIGLGDQACVSGAAPSASYHFEGIRYGSDLTLYNFDIK